MPEYLAIIHHHSQQDDEGAEPPSADEVNDMFLRMTRAGVTQVVH